ncbi:ROK family protein [Streptomyces sp. HNM1019]|uniref:ROK family protein n=1 Tax=Streptomyces sp. HNM1019 TaxID=3424717 RepID=UPI003D786D56
MAPPVTVAGHRRVGRQRRRKGPAPPILGWRDAPLAQRLHGAVGLPVVVESHTRALALAEHWFGAAVGVGNVLHLFVVTRRARTAGLGAAGRDLPHAHRLHPRSRCRLPRQGGHLAPDAPG